MFVACCLRFAVCVLVRWFLFLVCLFLVSFVLYSLHCLLLVVGASLLFAVVGCWLLLLVVVGWVLVVVCCVSFVVC